MTATHRKYRPDHSDFYNGPSRLALLKNSTAQRTCLRCGNKFKSSGIGNRLCKSCSQTAKLYRDM